MIVAHATAPAAPRQAPTAYPSAHESPAAPPSAHASRDKEATLLGVDILARIPAALSGSVLRCLEVPDFIKLGRTSRIYRSMTTRCFPDYATEFFLRYRAVNVLGGLTGEVAAVIRECRERNYDRMREYQPIELYPWSPAVAIDDVTYNDHLAERSWTCIGQVKKRKDWLLGLDPVLRTKINDVYQPVDDMLAHTHQKYFRNKDKFLLQLAKKCRQFIALNPLTSRIVAQMSSEVRIKFEIDYCLSRKEFKEAMQYALRIGPQDDSTRDYYLGYVLNAMMQAHKIEEVLSWIIELNDPNSEFRPVSEMACSTTSEYLHLAFQFSRRTFARFGIAIHLLEVALEKVWREEGLSKAIEMAFLINSTHWRSQAITFLIRCLTKGSHAHPSVDFDYTFNPLNNIKVPINSPNFDITIDVDQAVRLFDDFSKRCGKISYLHRLQYHQAHCILNVIKKNPSDRRNRRFKSFLLAVTKKMII